MSAGPYLGRTARVGRRIRTGRASRLGGRIRKMCDVLLLAFCVDFAFTVWRRVGRENPVEAGHFGVRWGQDKERVLKLSCRIQNDEIKKTKLGGVAWPTFCIVMYSHIRTALRASGTAAPRRLTLAVDIGRRRGTHPSTFVGRGCRPPRYWTLCRITMAATQ